MSLCDHPDKMKRVFNVREHKLIRHVMAINLKNPTTYEVALAIVRDGLPLQNHI